MPSRPLPPDARIAQLKRRMAVHRRRLRYWSGLPSFSGFGPSGDNLKSSLRQEKYELACTDAIAVAQELEACGVKVRVVDLRATFQVRYHNPAAPEVLLWPQDK